MAPKRAPTSASTASSKEDQISASNSLRQKKPPPSRPSTKPPSPKSPNGENDPKNSTDSAAAAAAGAVPTRNSSKLVYWSKEDEITLLERLAEFGLTGSNSVDVAGFQEFVKDSIRVPLTKSRLSEKIRLLRERYRYYASVAAEPGKDLSFPTDHERLAYQLAEKIWGYDTTFRRNAYRQWKIPKRLKAAASGDAVASVRKTLARPEPNAIPELNSQEPAENCAQKRPLWALYPNLSDSSRLGCPGTGSGMGLGEADMRRGLDLMDDSKLKEWDERWMDLQAKERDLFMERTTLAYEIVKCCYLLMTKSSAQLIA